MTSEPITIRKAAATDIPAIAALQLRSMQALGGAYYPAQVLAGFLGRFGTMDFAGVDEGQFFVATDRDGRLLGTGGWSRRPPGYQQDAGRPGPREVATMRGSA